MACRSALDEALVLCAEHSSPAEAQSVPSRGRYCTRVAIETRSPAEIGQALARWMETYATRASSGPFRDAALCFPSTLSKAERAATHRVVQVACRALESKSVGFGTERSLTVGLAAGCAARLSSLGAALVFAPPPPPSDAAAEAATLREAAAVLARARQIRGWICEAAWERAPPSAALRDASVREIVEVLRGSGGGGGAARAAAAAASSEEGSRLAWHSDELRALVAEHDAMERLRVRLESACRGEGNDEGGEDATALRALTADAAAEQRVRRVAQMRSSDGHTWLTLLCDRNEVS